jgi:hypothetical protein
MFSNACFKLSITFEPSAALEDLIPVTFSKGKFSVVLYLQHLGKNKLRLIYYH